MKDKFLQFFTGKMSKSIYISIAAAVVCGAVVITSVVVVHDKNQKIDAVLESLSASESVSESAAESVSESVSASDNTDSQPQAQAANNEPSRSESPKTDNQSAYFAELTTLTDEYQKKRQELKEEYDANRPQYALMPEPRERLQSGAGDYLETEEEYAQYLEEYENEKKRREEENSQREDSCKHITEQIDALDAQYEKDVAALKTKYGIS